jgi:hypothetical protein
MSDAPNRPAPSHNSAQNGITNQTPQNQIPNRKSQYQARLENQKSQLERHGNYAEVVIRTTPEGTDMINFARLWEYVLVQADRQTRGYVAKSSRKDFEATRQDFDDSIEFMSQKLRTAIARHHIDMSGTNFISRVAQRYKVVEKVRKGPAQTPPAEKTLVDQAVAAPETAAKKPTRVKKTDVLDEVDAL